MNSQRFPCLLLLGFLASLAADRPVLGAGERPRDVAVSPDGAAVLVTSWGSNTITLIEDGIPGRIDVAARSWGACFLDDSRAVVTAPELDAILLVDRFTRSAEVIDAASLGVAGALYDSTEVIPGPDPGTVLVANRGRAPAGGESWQHAVYEIDVLARQLVRTFITEREPRALVLSPRGARLFVGTVQGALGGAGIHADSPLADRSFDGGSIVAYDTTTAQPTARFAIGSPVRGLAVWDPSGDGSSSTYRVFFSHAGEGAQGEDPQFGGREIPNVVGSLLIDVTNGHNAISRQDVVFEHAPDTEGPTAEDPFAFLPAVLPERLVVRKDPTGAFELWVTNSASGTLSRAKLDGTDGHVLTSGSVDLRDFLDAGSGDIYKVVTSRTGPQMTIADADPSNALVTFGVVSQPIHLLLDGAGSAEVPYSSNPRGLAWNAVADELLAVTQFDGELVRVDGETLGMSRVSIADDLSVADAAERRFFTFGAGFDFREVTGTRKVNNIACSTCHVEGHIDGKVRMTRLQVDNRRPGAPDHKVVAVPSVFDVGQTEWIFFEGLRTIQDTHAGCGYCDGASFFPQTAAFTNSLSSPPSAYAPDGSLDDSALRGRHWFERMNCSRCHSSATQKFLRTNDPDIPKGNNEDGPAFGPLPFSLSTRNNLLHDATQSFIAELGPLGTSISLRNMTDVGTRIDDGNLFIQGVNTPALANAWDAAPYLHDGRYRTLEAVLDHTWLARNDGNRAAPVWALPGPPDNTDNALRLGVN
ncbi:MAG: hypothetical protein D6738_11825, partial [Acidobacteria bacterium]